MAQMSGRTTLLCCLGIIFALGGAAPGAAQSPTPFQSAPGPAPAPAPAPKPATRAPAATPESQVQPPAGPRTEPVANAKYLGCYRDQADRDLNGFAYKDAGMTSTQCVSICRDRGFSYAATQAGFQCFCGNSFGRSGPANNCVANCLGNPNQICGGVWANSVYQVQAR